MHSLAHSAYISRVLSILSTSSAYSVNTNSANLFEVLCNTMNSVKDHSIIPHILIKHTTLQKIELIDLKPTRKKYICLSSLIKLFLHALITHGIIFGSNILANSNLYSESIQGMHQATGWVF
jgi:hypothetical protein